MELYTSPEQYVYVSGGALLNVYTSPYLYSNVAGGEHMVVWVSDWLYAVRPIATLVYSPEKAFNLLSTVLYAWGKNPENDVSDPYPVVTVKSILWTDVSDSSLWNIADATGYWNTFFWKAYEVDGLYLPDFTHEAIRPNYVRITYVDISPINIELKDVDGGNYTIGEPVYSELDGTTTALFTVNGNNKLISSLRIFPTNVVTDYLYIHKIEFGV